MKILPLRWFGFLMMGTGFICAAYDLGTGAADVPEHETVLVCSTEEHDFGVVRIGYPVSVELQLQNVSANESVHVLGVRAECGCTAASVIAGSIAPGTAAILAVEFTPGTSGLSKKRVVVEYSTGQHDVRHAMCVSFKADVRLPLTISPQMIEFHKSDVELQKFMTISPAESQGKVIAPDVQITGIDVRHDVFVINRDREHENVIGLLVSPEKWPNDVLRTSVLIFTSDPHAKVQSVDVCVYP